MRILLPPSETKRPGGRQSFSPEELFLASRLEGSRVRVREALASVSVDEASATKALKLGVKNRDERLHNLALCSSGALSAIERYTGVLYDALGVQDLCAEARRWVDAHVLVQSALFGLLRASDPIPTYRLSASSRLPPLGGALAKQWADAHDGALEGEPYALDLRSKDYAGLAPLPSLRARNADYLEVVARSESGEVRALNHFNKAAKGDLVRRLANAAPHVQSRAELLDWAAGAGVDLVVGDEPGTLRLVTDQGVSAARR